MSLVRYVHNNPVRAGLAETAGGYAWSSHGYYLQKTRGLVHADKILRLFSEKEVIARRKYAEFVNAEDSNDGFVPYAAYEQQIVGDESFVEEVKRRVKHLEKRVKKIPLTELVHAIEKETGIGLLEMVSRKRGNQFRHARATLVVLAREMGYNTMELQEVLKRDSSVLSRIASVGETRVAARTIRKVRGRLNAQSQA